jgi:poly-beta-1,6-N-acetyl-D-glucosamine synthase
LEVGFLGVGNWTAGVSEVVFWLALFALAYVYAGYPIIAALRSTLRPKPRRSAPIEPSVSILVVAHNEAERIGARIENLLTLDDPRDRLEIVIASDGSTDDTVARARAYEDADVRVVSFPDRRGKAAVISAVVPSLRRDIVVFADARQRFAPDCLRALIPNFADPVVGGVSGELVLSTSDRTATAARGTAFYWRYEKFIRSTEGQADSTVGATGAIYAIRRELFEPIPADTIVDDVLIPLRIVRKGYRVLFEPRARAYDQASATAQQEFVRKARTIAGTFQLFARERWLLNPWQNRLWFETVSHKGLRLVLPLLHAVVLTSNIALGDRGVYGWLLAGQVGFYGAALVGYAQRQSRRRAVVFSVPCAVCLLCWATVVGFVRFARGRQQATWDRVSPENDLLYRLRRAGVVPAGRR